MSPTSQQQVNKLHQAHSRIRPAENTSHRPAATGQNLPSHHRQAGSENVEQRLPRFGGFALRSNGVGATVSGRFPETFWNKFRRIRNEGHFPTLPPSFPKIPRSRVVCELRSSLISRSRGRQAKTLRHIIVRFDCGSCGWSINQTFHRRCAAGELASYRSATTL